jgi:aryl-alcohol dehydrogenase-like predicted oxidoreductase
VAPSPEAAERLILEAIDAGVRHFDTASLYGFGANEELVGRVLAPHRDDVVIASKCGMTGVNGVRTIDGRPETLRRTAEESLRRLRTEVIDLYYLHRVDKQVPVEESIGALAELTLRRAHAVHPIAAVQNEYSLWSRNPELGTLAACAELGVTLVAFSPLARGLLTGAPPDPATLPAKDIRLNMPRFGADNYPANLALRDQVAAIAASAGVGLAQLALAWVLSRGDHVVAIPGTRSAQHVRENVGALSVDVPAAALAAADAALNADTVHGPRYNAATLAELDTERFTAAG